MKICNEDLKYCSDYSHKSYYDDLVETFDPLGLIQLVEFETWKRLVNGTGGPQSYTTFITVKNFLK